MTVRARPGGSALEVLAVFLRLGCTSFGGPIAHLGHFHRAFVVQRAWLGDAAYAELLALCQFLPGPASSQLGFAIGLQRAGLAGGLAAWLGFTLPSALLMLLGANLAATLTGGNWAPVLHGLKLLTVVVVAQALWVMARGLVGDRPRRLIALLAMMLLVMGGDAAMQLAVMLLSALLGLWLCRPENGVITGASLPPVDARLAGAALAVFLLLLAGLPLLAAGMESPGLRNFTIFYRSGALVFGGGHVVLPLLQTALVSPGLVGREDFLAAYGLAQALPGPLFAIAAWLGAVAGPSPLAGAAIGIVGLFLPGLLLMLAVLPHWHRVRGLRRVQAALAGANAGVVGILAVALWNPVAVNAIAGAGDLAIVLLALGALASRRCPAWLPLMGIVLAGSLLARLTG